jgi:hypothetical protein
MLVPEKPMFRFITAFVLVLAAIPAYSQTPTASAAAPQHAIAAPKVLLLVYQQFLPGKAGTRQNLETEIARTFDRLAVPISWIELESLTGPTQSLFIDPASSFAEIERAGNTLAQVYGARADLAQSQQQMEDMVSNARTVTATLREDLSANSGALNLAKARYMRVRVVQVRPERERDFVSAITSNRPATQPAGKALAAYQVNAGFPDLTFIFFEPMRAMLEVDQGLANTALELVPLGASVSRETNLYAIHPEMSHVGKDFAAADPAFWMPTPTP